MKNTLSLFVYLLVSSLTVGYSQHSNTEIAPDNSLVDFCPIDYLWQEETANPNGFFNLQEELDALLYQKLQDQEKAVLSSDKSMLTIPVVVHIVHANGPENISDEQVLAGIQHLNDAFSNTGYYDQGSGSMVGINFCLAKQDPQGNLTTGITRHESDEYTDVIAPGEDINLKNNGRWNPTCYLNIWVVRSIFVSSIGVGAAGYAYFPSAHGSDRDGIVVISRAMGESEARSTTLVHEVGHYLGVYHTFQGGCQNDDCLEDGDRVCDTPPDQSTSYIPCDQTVNTCNTDSNSGFLTDQVDDTQNYMDYQTRDCRNDFTIGQAERMLHYLSTTRSSLLGCSSCQDPCPEEMVLELEPDTIDVAIGANFSFAPAIAEHIDEIEWYLDNQLITTGPTFDYQFFNLGFFELKAIGTNNLPNCSPQDDRVIIRTYCETPPFVNILADTLYFVLGQDVTIPLEHSAADTITWSINGTESGMGENYVFNFTTYGQFYLDVEGFTVASVCKDTDRVLVIVDCPIDASFSVSQQTALVGDTVTFSASDNSFSAYRWYLDGELVGASNSISIPFYDSGTFAILMVAEGEQCERASEYYYLRIDNPCSYEEQVRKKSVGAGGVEFFKKLDNGNYILLQQTNGLALLDADLNSIWENNITTPSIIVRWYHATEDPFAGGYIMVGELTFPEKKVVIMKMDEQGNVLWTKKITAFGSDLSFTRFTITPVADGNFILTLNSGYNWGIPGTQTYSLIAKIDSEGNLLWSRGYDRQNFSDFVQTPDGGYLLTGSSSFSYLLGLTKLDASGNVEWAKRYSIGPSNSSAYNYGIHPMADDAYLIIIGKANYPEKDRLIAVKVNSNGDVIFSKQFQDEDALGQNQRPRRSTSSLDGGVLVTFNYFNDEAYLDSDLLRFDALGGLQWVKRTPDASYLYMNHTDFGEIIAFGWDGDYGIVEEDGSMPGCETEDVNYSFFDIPITQQSTFLLSVIDYYHYDVDNGEYFYDDGVIFDQNLCFSPGLEAYDAQVLWNSIQTCGDSLSINLTLCNKGNLPIPANCPLSFYTADPTSVATETFYTSTINSVIPVDECRDLVIKIPMVAATAIFVMINDDGSQMPIFDLRNDFPVTDDYECNFFNNLTSISLDELIITPLIDWETIEDTVMCAANNLLLEAPSGFDNYLWQDGSVERSFLAITPGTYIYHATTDCGQEATDTVVVAPIVVPTLDLGPDLATCQNQVINLTAPAGFITYQWQDGSEEPTYTATDAGTYWLEVVDECGQLQVDTLVLSYSEGYSFDLGEPLTICSGEELVVEVQANYTSYQWYPATGVTCMDCPSTTLQPLTTTQYTLLADDGGDCYSSDTLTVTVHPNLFATFDFQICAGETIDIFDQPVSVTGTYEQTFVSATGCDSTVEVHLEVLPLINTSESLTICAGETISIFGQPTGTTGEYTQINIGENGCDSIHTIYLDVLPVIVTTESIESCPGESIELFGEQITESGLYESTFPAISGCDSIHQVSVVFWEEVSTSEDISICTGESVEIFGNQVMVAGEFEQVFNSVAGCDSIHHISVVLLPTSMTFEEVSICEGESTELFGQVISEAGDYSQVFTAVNGCDSIHLYHLDILENAGSFQVLNICPGEAANVFGEEISNQGTYQQHFEAANGCDSLAVIEVVVEEEISFTAEVSPSCEGADNGSIVLSVLSGDLPLSFTWPDGLSNTASLLEVSPGSYAVSVTDPNGCIVTSEWEVLQAGFPDYQVVTQEVLCAGQNNGEIILTGSLDGLETSLNNSGQQAITTYEQLVAGAYLLEIFQQDGCLQTHEIVIEEPIPLSIETASIISSSCANSTDGSISVEVLGGTESYLYQWDNGENDNAIEQLLAGTYALTVTDNNQCQIDTSFQLTPVSTIQPNININYGCGDGSILITTFPSGGQEPYQFLWSNDHQGAILGNAAAGNYQLTITDAQQCTIAEEINVDYVSPFTISYNVTEASCADGQDGAIDLNITGGLPPYHINWSTGETTESLLGIPPGQFEVNITSGSCAIFQAITVGSPPQMELNLTFSAQGESLVAAMANVSGGTPPYSYEWSNNQTGTIASDLFPQENYTVWVTDSQGCTLQQQFTPELTSAIDIKEDELQFRLYPNPTTGVLNLVFSTEENISKYDLVIYNTTGEVMTIFNNLTNPNFRFSCEGFPAGVYYVQLRSGKAFVTKKIVMIR